MSRHTTLRRAASAKAPPAPFVSTRTCRPCGGTGVGESFGSACETCGGTGDAPSLAPRQRRRVVENEPPRPTEAQLDQLGRLIDDVDWRHPEQQYAADLVGRTDATEAQVLAAIAALELLVVPRETRALRALFDEYDWEYHARANRAYRAGCRPQRRRP